MAPVLYKRVLQAVVVIAVLAAAFAFKRWLQATRPTPEKREAGVTAPLLEVIEANRADVRVTVTGYGEAESRRTVRLAAEVPGEIVHLSPALFEGGSFETGDLLVQVDPRDYRLAERRAEAQVKQDRASLESLEQEEENLRSDLELAEAAVELSRRDLDRARRLEKAETGSASAAERAEAGWVESRSRAQSIRNQLALLPARRATTQARLEQSLAQLEDARLGLERTEVRAPFEGRTTRRNVSEGDFVGAGAVVAEIYASDVLEVAVDLPLEDYDWVETEGLAASERFTTSSVIAPHVGPNATAWIDIGMRRFEWQGRVVRTAGEVDRIARTAGVIAAFGPEPASGSHADLLLVPGMFLTVEIEGRMLPDVFAVPRGAIDQDGDAWVVAVSAGLGLSEADGFTTAALQRRPLSVARVQGDEALVTDGLEAGDLIVVSPLSAPVDGMVVRPLPADGLSQTGPVSNPSGSSRP